MSKLIPLHIADKAVAALNAEIDRLTLLQAETVAERNKAEAKVERLRAAGDALELFITYAGYSFGARSGLIRAWNAAKEDAR